MFGFVYLTFLKIIKSFKWNYFHKMLTLMFKKKFNQSNEWKLIPKSIFENIITSVFKH